MYKIMAHSNSQKQLLHDITVIGFVLYDLMLYLDTHPTDQNGLDYFNHYNKIYTQMRKEYALRYGPLTPNCYDRMNNEWTWVTEKMPWEGEC